MKAVEIKTIIEAVADPLMIINTDYEVILANSAAIPTKTESSIHCYEVSHHSKSPCAGTFHPCPLKKVLKERKSIKVLHEHFLPDGQKRIVEITATPLFEGNKIWAIVEYAKDVTEKVLSEKKLSFERSKSELILYSLREGVIATDQRGRILTMSKGAEQITGYTLSEAQGCILWDVLRLNNNGSIYKEFQRCRKGCSFPKGTKLKRKSGSERLVEGEIAPFFDEEGKFSGMVIVFRDITDRVKMEEEILRSKKLESLGVLAGGIAHDFRNILTSTMGYLSLIRYEMDDKEKLYEHLDLIEKSVDRMNRLSTELLIFSKGGSPLKKALSVDELIKETVKFVLRDSNINFHIDIKDAPLWISADGDQLYQAITNLIINAKEAMPEGGELTIKAEICEVKKSILPLEPGSYVKIEISDTGEGIPEDALPNIFDPYFTTKEKGSGLGLAVVYSVIKRHNGYITVDSEKGKGTTFHIYLPLEKKHPMEFSEEKRLNSKEIKGLRILFMDDEPSVREVSKALLESLGASLVSTTRGEEALEEYKRALERDEPFDLVILDLSVREGLGGVETLTTLKEIDPHCIALATSGYSDEPVLSEYDRYGFKGIIPKPFNRNSLLKAIGEAL